MKTLNTYYTDQRSLKKFVLSNKIKDSSSILIQVFTAQNDVKFIQSITSQIDKLLPSAHLIGASTDGEIKDGEVSTEQTVISFSIFTKTSLEVYISKSHDRYKEAGEKLALNLITKNTKAIITFIDGLRGNGEEFLNGISSVNSDIKIAGGMAGDNGKFENTYVFTKTEVLSNGVVGVSLNSDVLKVITDYSFHWLPVGIELIITKAEANRVYTINNQTAYNTYAHYLGIDVARGLPAVGIEFPLIIQRDGISIARAVTASNDDGSLLFAGNLKTGDKVMFGYGDIDAILGYKHKHLKKFLGSCIESIFLYSCMARRRFMPELINNETKPFNQIAPTSGFFTYGEFYSSKKSELLNQTMTIFALSEIETCNTIKIVDLDIEYSSSKNDTIKALSHLINVSSYKLQKNNQMQTDVYRGLYEIGRGMNETLEVDELFDITAKFVIDKLNFEKCLIFKHDDYNGWFKIDKAVGYDTPKEKMILKIINLLLSGEVIEYLRVNDDPIIHTQLNPDEKVQKLANSLFLSEAYFELFGGDVDIPYGLVVVGNGFENLKTHSRIFSDEMIMLALGNFTIQLSNSINNSIFYKAWNDEKKGLEKKIEERTKEIQKQRDSFEAIYYNSKDSIAILDMQSKFLEVNPAYVELTGMSREELQSTSCFALTAQKDVQPSKDAMAEVIKIGYIKNFEKDCSIKDGKYITINMSMSLLKNPNRVLISVRDVSRLKEDEKVLELAKLKAEESTKAKSEFLANMSHEIRTPMNGIIGMSHLALLSNLDDKQRKYIKNIDSSATTLLRIINDILDFSKIEAGKLKIDKVDFIMSKLLDEVMNITKYKVEQKNLKLTINCTNTSDKIFNGDSLRISQVLTNLLSNSIKFTDSGEIGIYINKASKDRFRFEVKDTGIGLDKNEQDKLFDSFSQADGSTTRKYGGTGLGLSISKQLVELMGGTIWIESKKGEGSSFIFEIDLVQKDTEQSSYFDSDFNKKAIEELDLSKEIEQLNGSKILLVEDNIINQDIVLGLLENSGVDIDIANNGAIAVESFKNNKYELIFMDLQMPIMGGIEATKLIREIDSTIPIIALTANAMKEDAQRTKYVGMNEHLNKPIDAQKLYEVVLKYIAKKSSLRLENKTNTNNTHMPKFKTLDTTLGLKYLVGNAKLYMKILNDFYNNYKEFNLDDLDDKEFKIATHTLKGLSQNIGATKLYQDIKELDESQDKSHMPRVHEELAKVILELSKIEKNDEKIDKKDISDNELDELFLKLKKMIETKQPKKYRLILEKLDYCKLSVEHQELLNKLKEFLSKYRFNEAIELLQDKGV